MNGDDGKAAVYGLLHAAVDAACAYAVWSTGSSTALKLFSSFWIVLGYDVIAFATQAPLGVLTDRLRISRLAVYAGLVLPALAVVLAGQTALSTMLLAGFGNALFHIGAGASVLRAGKGRATPAGLFVAPGALGLALGIWLGKNGYSVSWILIVALVASMPLIDRLHCDEPPGGSETRTELKTMALLLFLVSVSIRSYAGFGGCSQCIKTATILVGIPMVAFGGKLIGGLVSDRLGWLKTSVVALLVSAPMIAFNHGNPMIALPGLLLFQMTMPVTLAGVWHLMPDRPATAFGLPCLALIAGAIPTFFTWGRIGFFPSSFLFLIVLSAVAVAGALHLSGLGDGPCRHGVISHGDKAR
ncbi:MAG: hypothetical protein WC889_15280 [Myxococcota bacterium]